MIGVHHTLNRCTSLINTSNHIHRKNIMDTPYEIQPFRNKTPIKGYKEKPLHKSWFTDRALYPRIRAVAKLYTHYTKIQLILGIVRLAREVRHLISREKWSDTYTNKQIDELNITLKRKDKEFETLTLDRNKLLQQEEQLEHQITSLTNYCNDIHRSAINSIVEINSPIRVIKGNSITTTILPPLVIKE